jgi:hypothetical protein
MLHYADYLFLMLCIQVKIYVEGSIPTAVKQQTLCRLSTLAKYLLRSSAKLYYL